jgi:hypothetical protein
MAENEHKNILKNISPLQNLLKMRKRQIIVRTFTHFEVEAD